MSGTLCLLSWLVENQKIDSEFQESDGLQSVHLWKMKKNKNIDINGAKIVQSFVG